MRLCLVTPYFTTSLPSVEYNLVQSLLKYGHEITILTSKRRAPREIMPKSFKELQGLRVRCLPTIVDIGKNPIILGFNAKEFKNYDVIFLQGSDHFICQRVFFNLHFGIRKILLYERSTYLESPIRNLIVKFLNKTINKKIINNMDKIVAYSSEAKKFLEREVNTRRSITVIHIGVDTEFFKPIEGEQRCLKEGGLKILTVARLVKRKGLDYLINSIYFLKKDIPNIKLYIRGSGPEQRNLKNLVKSLNLENQVKFLEEPIPQEMMPLLYGECDIYVQPSLFEPYGLTVLEAMSCGKPVIATKVGVFVDAIKNGETGFLIEPQSSEQLANKILELNDEKKRKKMGKKARMRIIRNFSFDTCGREFQNLLSNL